MNDSELDNHSPEEETTDNSVVALTPKIAKSVKEAPFSRQVPLILLVCVLVALAALFLNRRAVSAGNTGSPAAPTSAQTVAVTEMGRDDVTLETAKVTVEAGKRTVHTNGTVHYLPEAMARVSPKLQGRVKAVYVKIGDHVALGQPLLQLESTDAATAVGVAHDADEQLKLAATNLEIARKQFQFGTPEVTAAAAALEQAKENTSYTRRILELTREQSRIGGFTEKPLTDAQSAVKQLATQKAQDEKDLVTAQKQFDRTSKLFDLGLAAQQDMETAEATLGKAKDAVENDQEQLRIANITQDREEKAHTTGLYANQQVRQAEEPYQQAVLQERAAATALRLAKAAIQRELQQAEHDYRVALTDAGSAHTTLTHYGNPTADGLITITAPVTGIVTERDVNPGQMVDQTGLTPWQMLTIVDSTKVSVDAQAYEKDMIALRVGESVTVTTDALPHFAATGNVQFVAPGLDPNSHTLPVKAVLDNSLGKLKDGMYVSVTVDIGHVSPFPPRPIVPLTAVLHDGQDDYVYVVIGEGKYDRRKVTLGEQRGEDRVAIESGLTGEETIVTHGALYLGTGATPGN